MLGGESQNITVAVGAVAGALLSAWVAVVGNRIIKRDSLLSNWDQLATQLNNRIKQLEEDLHLETENCNRRIKDLEAEMIRKDENCKKEIAALRKLIPSAG